MKKIAFLLLFASINSFAPPTKFPIDGGVGLKEFSGGLITDEEARNKRLGELRHFIDCMNPIFFGEQCGDACRRKQWIPDQSTDAEDKACEDKLLPPKACFCLGK